MIFLKDILILISAPKIIGLQVMQVFSSRRQILTPHHPAIVILSNIVYSLPSNQYFYQINKPDEKKNKYSAHCNHACIVWAAKPIRIIGHSYFKHQSTHYPFILGLRYPGYRIADLLLTKNARQWYGYFI